jgi:hypothetical protein
MKRTILKTISKTLYPGRTTLDVRAPLFAQGWRVFSIECHERLLSSSFEERTKVRSRKIEGSRSNAPSYGGENPSPLSSPFWKGRGETILQRVLSRNMERGEGEGRVTHCAQNHRTDFLRPLLISAIILSAMVTTAMAQPRAAVDFQLLKINTNFISSPQFTYTGAEQFQADQRERWLEVEVTFACAPEFTDELTLKYFILFNGKLLTGEVTHVNIPAGRDNRSVMYVTPKTLQRLMLGRTITNNALQNTAVQLMHQGALKDEISAQRAAPQWYATLPQVSGLVLNKNETPFMPLYWDRYCQIKTPR